MRYLYLCILSLAFAAVSMAQPCTVNNGTGCLCPDGSVQCDLLPDITISWEAIQTYQGGPTEYSQTGNGANNGRLRVTGSTPNTGYGPFTVRGTDYFICGTDTIHDPTRTIVNCPGGGYPTNLLQQRIYQKDSNNINYYDRWAGGQTYHPGHGHNHVDDWVTFTLRLENPNEPDTLQWPIVGTGAKIGFCLMDLSNCNASNGHCRDVQTYGLGNVLTSADIPNYGMGGGAYNCSPVEQGISVGYVDIYAEGLEGMWIDIPPGTCNGDYWIVVEVDPRNNFLESNEDNNWTAVPFTLTKQTPIGQATATVNLSEDPVLCGANDTLVMTATPANTYLWSTGDTAQTIKVNTPGAYYVDITSPCGSARSDTITVTMAGAAITTTINDTLCADDTMQLFADGGGITLWYSDPFNPNFIGYGDTFTSYSTINTTTTMYAADLVSTAGTPARVGPVNHQGSNYDSDSYNGYLSFETNKDLTIKTVDVFTDYAGYRTIELINAVNIVIADTTVFIDSGASTIGLNFVLPDGTAYKLGTNEQQNLNTFGTSSPQLKRSDSLVSYPYAVSGLMNIYGSSDGSSKYFYFYNWEVEPSVLYCVSPRVPVTGYVSEEPSLSIQANSLFFVNDEPGIVQVAPPGGTLTGSGVTRNGQQFLFDPNIVTGGQDHLLTYTYTDTLGCTFSTEFNIRVLDTTQTVGLATPNLTSIHLYPNPGSDILHITTTGNALMQVQLMDLAGKLVYERSMSAQTIKLDLSQLGKGVYLYTIISEDGSYNGKIILQ